MLIERVELVVEVDSKRLRAIVDDKIGLALEAGRPVADFRVVRRWWVAPAFGVTGFLVRIIARWGYTIR